MLFPPTGDGPAASVDQIPDSARICDCNAVAKDQIVEAVLNGARSLRAVCEQTRAGTGCGSCRPEVQRIVDYVCREVNDGGVSPSIGENHASA
jgi:nitrite reductase (NADH) large subunit